MLLALLLTIWPMEPKPPKYMFDRPLRSCMVFDNGTVCCGWRGEEYGHVACYLGGDWRVVAEGGEDEE